VANLYKQKFQQVVSLKGVIFDIIIELIFKILDKSFYYLNGEKKQGHLSMQNFVSVRGMLKLSITNV